MKQGIVILLLLLAGRGMAQEPVNVALIMPFCSREMAYSPKPENKELSILCREYYQGMTIALDSLKQNGAQVKLTLFDTQNDSLIMSKLIQKAAFKEANLIIGPVLQGGNKMITPIAIDKKVFHVSPLMTFSKTKLTDPYWISTNPNLTSFGGIIYQFITSRFDSANVIVVSDQSAFDKNVGTSFKSIPQQSKKIKIKFVPYSATTDVNLSLSATLPNVVIVPTHNEQIANNVLYKLKDTTEINNLMCIGFQQWLDFKNADIALWEKKNLVIATTSFVDYRDAATRRFVELYRARYFTEPSEAAIKGYDQGLLLIDARAKGGKNFMDNLADKPVKTIHTTFRFLRQKDGGSYHNSNLNFIHFNNDNLEPVDPH